MISKEKSGEMGSAVRRTTWVYVGLFVGAFLLANGLVAQRRSTLEAERRENLLIADAEPARAGVVRDASGRETFESVWARIPDARSVRLVVVAGMSQMYAINERKPGDRIIAEWVDEWLEPRGGRTVSLAGPNLSTEEALFFLVASLGEARTRPSTFVYGVCFDKLRNVDLRAEYREFLRSRPGLLRQWLLTAERAKKDFPLAASKMEATASALGGVTAAKEGSGSASEVLEASLVRAVGAAFPVVAARQELNAWAQSELFLGRNWLLRIKPTSKRPQIGARYAMNLQFLELLVSVGKTAGVRLVLYVIPLNPLAENPYIPDEYARFKEWIEKFSGREAIPFANLEGVVPAEHWGEFMGGPDFKHFKGEGHRLTAATLIERFGGELAGARGVAP